VSDDGKTRGFWLFLLATLHKGRAILFHLVTYSSRTISEECLSRNWYHFEAFRSVKQQGKEVELQIRRMEKLVALVLIVYAICLLLGEGLRFDTIGGW